MRYIKLFEQYNLKETLTSSEMIDFIYGNRLKDSYGRIDLEDAKQIARSCDLWVLTEISLEQFNWVADSDFKNKSVRLPPIVLDVYGQYEVLDGKHRIGMAKHRGEKTMVVYLGTYS